MFARTTAFSIGHIWATVCAMGATVRAMAIVLGWFRGRAGSGAERRADLAAGATIRSVAVVAIMACSAMTLLLASEASAGPGGRGLAARPARTYVPAQAFPRQTVPTHRAFALETFAHRGRKFHGRHHDRFGRGAFGGFITSGPYDEPVDRIAYPTYVAAPLLQCRRSEEIKAVPSEDGGMREIKITRSTCLP